MTKLLSSVGLAIAIASMSLLAGCQLYFGDRDDTSGPGGPGRPPGFACESDAECAAGCYCEDGTCAEAGFCARDEDCGPGFHCDVQRSSCVPDAKCDADGQCDAGSMCGPDGFCVETCVCKSDAEAIRQGAGWCDEARGTCMPGSDPAGACLGELTCNTRVPNCPEGQVALIKDGCFTGECRAITACEAAPVCKSLQHQNDCAARTADCSILTTGHNCRRTDGSACQPGDSADVCKCESYTFAGCEAKTTDVPRLIVAD